MPDLNSAYRWSIEKCNQSNVGYSQNYRNQKTVDGIIYYDCSSFIWYALQAGGFDVKSAYRQATGETYSGNAITTHSEKAWLSALGFVQKPITGEWKSGDVLHRSGHTEMVYSGGTGSGITMGAHSASVPLDKQVSINTSSSSSSNWETLWRYGEGGGSDFNCSIYVISALCGNWMQESTVNPALWEGTVKSSFTSLNHGYGIGQWTNTGGDTHGRLYQLYQYLTSSGYAIDDGNAQIEYLVKENTWYPVAEAQKYGNLNGFLTSTSTDIADLTHAFNIGWEGIHDASWDTRVTYANECYDYLLEHMDDDVTGWITGNRFLSRAESYNNVLMAYKLLSGGRPPIPPKPPTPSERDKSKIWMMIRRR